MSDLIACLSASGIFVTISFLQLGENFRGGKLTISACYGFDIQLLAIHDGSRSQIFMKCACCDLLSALLCANICLIDDRINVSSSACGSCPVLAMLQAVQGL